LRPRAVPAGGSVARPCPSSLDGSERPHRLTSEASEHKKKFRCVASPNPRQGGIGVACPSARRSWKCLTAWPARNTVPRIPKTRSAIWADAQSGGMHSRQRPGPEAIFAEERVASAVLADERSGLARDAQGRRRSKAGSCAGLGIRAGNDSVRMADNDDDASSRMRQEMCTRAGRESSPARESYRPGGFVGKGLRVEPLCITTAVRPLRRLAWLAPASDPK